MAGNASNNNIDDALIMSVDFNSLQAKFAEAFRALFLEVNYVNSAAGCRVGCGAVTRNLVGVMAEPAGLGHWLEVKGTSAGAI